MIRIRIQRLITTASTALMTMLIAVSFMPMSTALAQDRGASGSSQSEQDDRPNRGNRGERGERGERGNRGDRADRGERGNRGERGMRGERGGRMGQDRPDRGGAGGPGGRRGQDGPGRGLGLMGTPEGLFTPDYMTRDVPMIVEELKLDDAQQAVVSQLFEDYDTTFRGLVDSLRTETEALNEAYVPDAEIEQRMEETRESMRALRDEAREARRSFGQGQRGDAGRRGERGGQEDPEAGDQPVVDSDEQPESREEREARAEAMRQEFRMQFEDMGAQMRSIRDQQFASTQMQELLDSRVAMIREFARDKKQLRDSTESGLRALLIDEQGEIWEVVSKKLRRLRLMPRGRLSGESTDVLEVLEDLDLDASVDTEDLQMLRDNYIQEIDSALIAREAFDYAQGLDLMEHFRNQDFSSGLDVLRQRLDLQESTRDVNDRYIDAITLVLPTPQSDEFRLDALRRGYSGIYRPTRGERAILAAMEIEDLDPEMLAAVADLMQRHGDEIATFNDDMLVVLRSEESQRELRRAEERMNRFLGERSDRGEQPFDPVRDALERRNEIDERYMASLEALLGAELFETVAGRRNRGRGNGPDRGGQGGFSREQVMSQFDKNGDGELDQEERQAFRDAMRERFGGGQGGQRGPGRGQGPREL